MYEVKDELIDLLRRCLRFSPKKRITAKHALHHPLLAPAAPKEGPLRAH